MVPLLHRAAITTNPQIAVVSQLLKVQLSLTPGLHCTACFWSYCFVISKLCSIVFCITHTTIHMHTNTWPNTDNHYWAKTLHTSKMQLGMYSRSILYLTHGFNWRIYGVSCRLQQLLKYLWIARNVLLWLIKVTADTKQELSSGATVPEQSGPKSVGGCCAPFRGEARFPCNTMSPGPRTTSVPSGILIHPAVWPEYTNITGRTDRQTDRRSWRVNCGGFTPPTLSLFRDWWHMDYQQTQPPRIEQVQALDKAMKPMHRSVHSRHCTANPPN